LTQVDRKAYRLIGKAAFTLGRAAVATDQGWLYWRPTRWGVGAFFACVALLAVLGGVGQPLAAVLGFAGIAAGTAAAGQRMRSELSDDGQTLALRRSAFTAVRCAGPLWLAMCGIYGALLVWHLSDKRAGAFSAAVAAVILVAVVGSLARNVARIDGLDREVLLRSAAFAFFATALSAATYALFEAFDNAPRLSMWVVWTFGMLTWAVSTAVVKARLS
jgi:hypothetical protein